MCQLVKKKSDILKKYQVVSIRYQVFFSMWTWVFLGIFKKGSHAEPVEAWWWGLCAPFFDGLRMTPSALLAFCFKKGCHAELVEALCVGLCAPFFDRLIMTPCALLALSLLTIQDTFNFGQ